jgi:hypothetical protein
MMDIVGFDTEAPKAMMNFVNGMIWLVFSYVYQLL